MPVIIIPTETSIKYIKENETLGIRLSFKNRLIISARPFLIRKFKIYPTPKNTSILPILFLSDIFVHPSSMHYVSSFFIY